MDFSCPRDLAHKDNFTTKPMDGSKEILLVACAECGTVVGAVPNMTHLLEEVADVVGILLDQRHKDWKENT